MTDTSHSSHRWLQGWRGNLLLLMVSLVLCVVVAELGLRIGPEVSVVGHDDLATSELLDPPLATIWLNRREMGRALMLRLLGRVPPDDYVAPVELIERASLQAPAPRPAQLPSAPAC